MNDDGRFDFYIGLLWTVFLSVILWIMIGLCAMTVLSLAGCHRPSTPSVVVRIQRCPLCGDSLVGGGFCTNCKIWYRIVGGKNVQEE